MADRQVYPVLDEAAYEAWQERRFGVLPMAIMRTIVQRRYDDGDLDGVEIRGRIGILIDLSTLESMVVENNSSRREKRIFGGVTAEEFRREVMQAVSA